MFAVIVQAYCCFLFCTIIFIVYYVYIDPEMAVEYLRLIMCCKLSYHLCIHVASVHAAQLASSTSFFELSHVMNNVT